MTFQGNIEKGHIKEVVSKYCVYVTYVGQWTILKIKILEEKFISFISGILDSNFNYLFSFCILKSIE